MEIFLGVLPVDEVDLHRDGELVAGGHFVGRDGGGRHGITRDLADDLQVAVLLHLLEARHPAETGTQGLGEVIAQRGVDLGRLVFEIIDGDGFYVVVDGRAGKGINAATAEDQRGGEQQEYACGTARHFLPSCFHLASRR